MKRKTALAALAGTLAPGAVRAQAAAPPYRIGVTIPLTGAFANTAAEYLPACQLGIDAVNRAGGVKGRPLQLLVEDSQATPQGGIAALRKLVEVNGVAALVTLFTNVVTAQVPLADQLQIPLLTIAEVPGVIAGAVYSFAHSTREAVVDPLLRAYWQKHGYKRIYAFVGNNAQGKNVVPLLRETALGAGAQFDAAYLTLSDTDFRGEIERMKEFNPDGILTNTSGSAAETTLLRQARELGVRAQYFTDSNFYSVHAWREAIGPYAEGMIFGGTNVDLAAARDFARAYRAKLGFLPGYPAGEMYDVIRIFADAIGRGGYTGPGIRTALLTVKGIPSALGGTIAMGPDHYTMISDVALWQVRHGKEDPVS